VTDDWISEVNAHSDTDCWCRGTHAEGLHSIWERRRDADQLRAENADLRARLAEVEDDHSRMVEWHDQQHARAEAAEAKLAAVEAEMNAYANAYAEANKRAVKAENQVRHWKEQEAKQRRLHHEQGEWKHRALAAELRASDQDRLRAEIEFMRAWCADNFGGLMPPTREQNAALMRALDEMENNRD
jgi:chromosome segregation ATPase